MRDLRFAVDELGAELDGDLEAGHAARPAAAADAITGLEHEYRAARARELVRRRQAGGAGADHDDIRGLRRGSQLETVE